MLICVFPGSDFRLMKHICYCMTNLHAQLTHMHLLPVADGHYGALQFLDSPTRCSWFVSVQGQEHLAQLRVRGVQTLWARRITAATQTLVMPRCSLHMQIWHIVGHIFCAWNSTIAFLTTCSFSTVTTCFLRSRLIFEASWNISYLIA